jgi:N-carbamoyl-L-amino-acid hydrolase
MIPAWTDVAAGIDFVSGLFDSIGAATFDGVGYTRASYGEGEQRAHDIVATAARELGLSVEVDAALNLSMTLPGSSPDKPPLLIGSHLDAVPQGGNFDGLAGVLAGLACAFAWKRSGQSPQRTIRVLGIRAEESAWFGAQHIGSRAMLGTLAPEIFQQAHRSDSGRSLADHMQEAGADITTLLTGSPLIAPSSIGAYVELHIEQGPVLVQRGMPIGIVTGIRGNRRCRRIVCTGAYGHSGTVPRDMRQDAVMAVSELVVTMDRLWQQIENEGGDLVLTFGQFFTDARIHSVTTVPGEATFSFDARSHSTETLARVERALLDNAEEISMRRKVQFAFDPMTGDLPALMDPLSHQRLLEGAQLLDIPAMPIASGAGHDAGDFAAAGIPSAMIFVRNDKGSHNPEEAMEAEDFALGVRLLAKFVADFDASAE